MGALLLAACDGGADGFTIGGTYTGSALIEGEATAFTLSMDPRVEDGALFPYRFVREGPGGSSEIESTGRYWHPRVLISLRDDPRSPRALDGTTTARGDSITFVDAGVRLVLVRR